MTNQTLYFYESGPLDHWHGWTPISLFRSQEISKFQLGNSDKYLEDIDIISHQAEKLFIDGLLKFHDILNQDLRGEWVRVVELNDNYTTFPVVALKADNNGQCYAFSYHLTSLIPNDFDCPWELKYIWSKSENKIVKMC